MGLETIELMTKVGQVLAIGPPRNCPKFPQKFYILVIFTSQCFFALVSIVKNDFFQQDNVIKMTIAYIIEILLAGFGFYVGIVLNFARRRQWFELLEGFSTVEGPKSLAKFYCLNFLYFVLTTVYVYLWFGYAQWDFFVRYGFREVQLYYQFFYKLFLIELIGLFLAEYRNVSLVLIKFLKHRRRLQNITSKVPLRLVRQTTKIILRLKNSGMIFNHLFGWPVAIILAFTTLQLLNLTLYSFSNVRVTTIDSVVFFLIKITTTFIWTSEFILLCHRVTEVQKITELIYDVRKHIASLDQRRRIVRLTELLRKLPDFRAV
nr:PREDICTED: uncharacterized protein LOC107398053 [Tribolium castaneum]|eukprot:XP_015836271.1 PREDICTED: uncharacterized protein LOC107398053 [Tribolium castaneum]